MKSCLQYFQHDVNAHEHPKFKALIAQWGFEGYGRFWALNEIISSAEGAQLDLSKKYNRIAVADKLKMSLDEFTAFIDYLSNPDESDLINNDDSIITTDRTQENLAEVERVREHDRNRKGLPSSSRKPVGRTQESTRNNSDSSTIPDGIHLESSWNPSGIQPDSANKDKVKEKENINTCSKERADAAAASGGTGGAGDDGLFMPDFLEPETPEPPEQHPDPDDLPAACVPDRLTEVQATMQSVWGRGLTVAEVRLASDLIKIHFPKPINDMLKKLKREKPDVRSPVAYGYQQMSTWSSREKARTYAQARAAPNYDDVPDDMRAENFYREATG